MSNGFNVDRRLVGGNTMDRTGDERRRAASQASPPVLQKAVVIDVIADPNLLTTAQKTDLQNAVNNYELIEVMPVNSIVAQVTSNEVGQMGGSRTILFPFFPSHMMFPIQPGEVVHVIYPDYVGRGTKVGFWMNRIHGFRTVEDVNYTHLDRQTNPNNNFGNWTLDSRNAATSDTYTPNFPNGGDIEGTWTISPTQQSRKPFEDIHQFASASIFTTPEPVPRWNKRPHEFVLQGANNTLIVLGEDRKGSPLGAITGSQNPGNDENPDIKGFAGTIDIVAGRGRYLPSAPNEEPELTAPRVITNSRGTNETDKAPFRGAAQGGGRKMDNPNEGNPDFLRDAARLYVSMQTTADRNFGVTDIPFPAATLPIVQPESADDTTVNRSYVVGKADHVRMIARSDPDNQIDGTLLLLREGDPTGSLDLGYMFIDKNGIQLEHNKIFIGTAAHDNPNETEDINYNDDDGPYEPWILWSKYRDTVNSLQTQIRTLRDEHDAAIKALRTEVVNLLTQLGTTMASGGRSIPYGPNDAVATAGGQISSAISKIQTAGDTNLQNAVTDIGDDESGEQQKNNSDNVSKVNHSQKIYGSKGDSE